MTKACEIGRFVVFKSGDVWCMRVSQDDGKWLAARGLIVRLARNYTTFPVEILSFDQDRCKPSQNGLGNDEMVKEVMVHQIPAWVNKQVIDLITHLSRGGRTLTSEYGWPNDLKTGTIIRGANDMLYLKITKEEAIGIFGLSQVHADSWQNFFASFGGNRSLDVFAPAMKRPVVKEDELTPVEKDVLDALRLRIQKFHGQICKVKAEIAKDMEINTNLSDLLYKDRREAAKKADAVIGSKPNPMPVCYVTQGDAHVDSIRNANVDVALASMTSLVRAVEALKRYGCPPAWEPDEFDAIVKAAQPFFKRARRINAKER